MKQPSFECRNHVQHVPNGVNVGTCGLFVLAKNLFVVGIGLDLDVVQSQVIRIGLSTHGRHDRVVFVGRSVRKGDPDFVLRCLFQFGRCELVFELYFGVFLHVVSNQVHTLPIESSEQHAPDRHGGIVSQSCQKSRTLQTDVGCAHAQDLAG